MRRKCSLAFVLFCYPDLCVHCVSSSCTFDKGWKESQSFQFWVLTEDLFLRAQSYSPSFCLGTKWSPSVFVFYLVPPL